MKNIYLSLQTNDADFHDNQMPDFTVKAESDAEAKDRIIAANGWANAYVMLDANGEMNTTIYYCGKSTGKSAQLAQLIADKFSGAVVYGGGEGYMEMAGTTMVSVFINIGIVELSTGIDTFYSKLQTALKEYFCADVAVDVPATEEPKKDEPVVDDGAVTDAEIGAAVRLLINAFRGM